MENLSEHHSYYGPDIKLILKKLDAIIEYDNANANLRIIVDDLKHKLIKSNDLSEQYILLLYSMLIADYQLKIKKIENN